MRYQVLMNESYMNSFESYEEASELVERLERQFKNAKIIIEPIY